MILNLSFYHKDFSEGNEAEMSEMADFVSLGVLLLYDYPHSCEYLQDDPVQACCLSELVEWEVIRILQNFFFIPPIGYK